MNVDDTRERLDLLTALGQGFLESGQSSSQTERTLEAVAAAVDLPDVALSVYGPVLTLEHVSPEGAVTPARGTAHAIDVIDADRLRVLGHLAQRVIDGRLDPGTALAEVQRVRDRRTPWWWTTAGLTMLAFFISLQVGVAWDAWIAAAAVQLTAALVGVAAGRFGVPRLFTATAQTTLGGLLAVALVQLGLVEPVGAAAAFAVSWLLILPLPQVIEAITDAVEGAYTSALVRVANVAVTAGGIAIGGSVVLFTGSALDLDDPVLDELPSLPWYLGLVFAALGAIANAFANGGRATLVLPAAALGIVTSAANQALQLTDLPFGWAAAIAAVLLGFVSVFLAPRVGYPYPVLALMGITGALLPGLTVFRGVIHQMSGGSGMDLFLQAGVTCIGLGVGVAFGVYAAVLTGAPSVRAQVAPPVRRR